MPADLTPHPTAEQIATTLWTSEGCVAEHSTMRECPRWHRMVAVLTTTLRQQQARLKTYIQHTATCHLREGSSPACSMTPKSLDGYETQCLPHQQSTRCVGCTCGLDAALQELPR